MDEPKNSLRGIFNEAAELKNAAERAAFLDRACAGDTEIRDRVEALLRAHDLPEGILEKPASTAIGEMIWKNPEIVEPSEKPGDRIGHYRLEEKIGEGGCGVVYRAQQEEPVRRTVALKVIRLGMDTKSVIARFEGERQALALMGHPNIAKILDAGATDLGRPYFVMELVDGMKITEYCDEARLATSERLELFMQVCAAVQHAHQKGIIHRDIKPSNILVTEVDGKPAPKVIDFGVAKATAGRLSDATVYTQLHQFIGTPAYISPEQASLGSLDLDTRSDIYSLGVVLYELMAGQPPFTPEELLGGGFEAMCEMIRQKEPARPSTRLATMKQEQRTATALRRQMEGPKLVHLLNGDLDWIVMKCLEKDRARRYETANALARDIERHLRNEPVLARPPGRFYRFQRSVRRNKLIYGTTTVVALALVTASGVSTREFLKEKAARERAIASEQKAITAAARSEQVAGFLKDMLTGVGPSVALGRDTTLLREILDKTTEQIKNTLPDQPEVGAELRNTIGSVFAALGDYPKSLALHSEALGMLKNHFGETNADVAISLNNVAFVLLAQGKLDEAEGIERRAIVIQRTLFGQKHPALAQSLDNLSRITQLQGKTAEAETMAREALAMRRDILPAEHPDLAQSLNSLAIQLQAQGRLNEAEALQREALKMLQKLLGENHPTAISALNNLAVVLRDEGEFDQAERMQTNAVALSRKILGAEHPDVALALDNLGIIFKLQNRLAEAETVQREALAMRRRFFGNEHLQIAQSLNNLATVLQSQGNLAEAETFQREALAMQEKLVGKEHAEVAQELNNLAMILRDQGKFGESEKMQTEALEIGKRAFGVEHPAVAQFLDNLSIVFKLEERFGESEIRGREALAMRQKFFGEEHPIVAQSLNNVAATLQNEGKLAEAETLQRKSLAMHKKLLGADRPETAADLNNLAIILRDRSQLADAEAMLQEALAINRKTFGQEHPTVARVMSNLAFVLEKGSKFAEAESLYRQALEIRIKALGEEHVDVASSRDSIANVLCSQANYTQAEPLVRQAVVTREKFLPGNWRVFASRSLLGGILVRQKRYSEAAPLLISAYDGLREGKGMLPAEARSPLPRTLSRLVELYEATGESAKATEWKQRLTESNRGSNGPD